MRLYADTRLYKMHIIKRLKFIYCYRVTENMGTLSEAWAKLIDDVKKTWVLKFDDENEEVLFLSNALAGECGELAKEVKKWFRVKLMDDVRSVSKQQLNVELELMDVLYYVVKISEALNINIEDAWEKRLRQSEKRWRGLKRREQL